MTTLSISNAPNKSSVSPTLAPLLIALSDVYRGFIAFTRNGMALLGGRLLLLASAGLGALPAAQQQELVTIENNLDRLGARMRTLAREEAATGAAVQ